MKTRISKEALQTALNETQNEAHYLRIALNAFMDGETSPAFRNKDYTMRIVRPSGAEGGILLLTYHPNGLDQKPYTSVHQWEAWWKCFQGNIAAFSESPETLALRELGFKAQEYIFRSQNAQAA